MKYVYFPTGVCSKKMEFTIENNIVTDVKIDGGCPGNTLGVSKLCAGKSIEEIILLLENIPCGLKETSCPDQIAKALKKFKKET